MAHTKSQKAASGNRDSRSKRLGVKLYGGQTVAPGNVIIRQKGSKVQAGPGTLLSSDFTIVATAQGKVAFKTLKGKKYVFVSN